ncbi:MAG: ABC transporter permease [Nanoarchaeota archaeon]|nr:ABC transporter permease [Nanoarchaeota archaeon]
MRFFSDIKKYREYFLEAIKTELKLELSRTYLGYIWWILDPLMYMAVYVFLVQIVLGRGGPNYPIFIFSAILPYRWISRSLFQTSDCIIKKKNIINQVYIPKFLLPLIKVVINTVYFIFSLFILFFITLFYKDIKLSMFTLHLIPIIIVNFIFLYSIGVWLAHIGCFFYDIEKVLNFLLRFLFYASPILFSIEDLPHSLGVIMWFNPFTPIIQSYRNVILFNLLPFYKHLGVIFVGSIIMLYFGIRTLYHYDGVYTKTF